MTFQWKKINILVVEDEESMREIVSVIFEIRGVQVFSASNGKMALEVLKEQRIDLVFSDIQMPVMDGIELLKQIRQQNAERPFVLLATGHSHISAHQAESLGAKGLVQKPYETTVLLEKVQSLFPQYV